MSEKNDLKAVKERIRRCIEPIKEMTKRELALIELKPQNSTRITRVMLCMKFAMEGLIMHEMHDVLSSVHIQVAWVSYKTPMSITITFVQKAPASFLPGFVDDCISMQTEIEVKK